MNTLNKIIESKKQELQVLENKTPIEVLRAKHKNFKRANMLKALTSDVISVIAEIKQKSPSEGIINKTNDPVEIAESYENNGAAAISVLTDNPFFGGSIELLSKIKSSVQIQILRKDFIISEYQVYESYLHGADALLLIADILEYSVLESLYEKAMEIGLKVLVEAHSMSAIKKVKKLKPEICGVNSRNLETMEIDLKWFETSYHHLPETSIKIAESGIHSNEHVRFVDTIGYDAILVGTSLMNKDNPGLAIPQFLDGQ